MKRWDSTATTTAASHLLAWATFLWLVFWPSYQGDSVSVTADGKGLSAPVRHTATLIEVNGEWVVLLLLVPVACTALACLTMMATHRGSARRTVLLWITAIILSGLSFVSMASIGMLFLPAALTLLLAAGFAQGQLQERTSQAG